MRWIGIRRLCAAAVLVPLVGAGYHLHAASQVDEDELRATLEGSWVLEEWHQDGKVLRPPAIGGRWTLYDGIVMANVYRTSDGSYESFSAYGRYELEGMTWSYGYERVQTAGGPSAEEATVTVRSGLQMQAFAVHREGDVLILERPNDRREYEGPVFRFMPGGTLLRQYRKTE